jgi:hypothetical protein
MAFVDFTNPGAWNWYQSKLKELLEIGVDVFKVRIRSPCYSLTLKFSRPISENASQPAIQCISMDRTRKRCITIMRSFITNVLMKRLNMSVVNRKQSSLRVLRLQAANASPYTGVEIQCQHLRPWLRHCVVE